MTISRKGSPRSRRFFATSFRGATTFAADGKVYHKGANIHVEIYTDKKDPELEKKVEDVLDAHEVFYNKSETWIGSEQLYEVLYIFGWEA